MEENNKIRIGNSIFFPSNESGVIILGFNYPNSTPILKMESNGDIFVNGKLIENDKEVVDGLREFFNLTKLRIPLSEAFEFAVWSSNNMYCHISKGKWNKVFSSKEYKTTSELYQLFKQENSD